MKQTQADFEAVAQEEQLNAAFSSKLAIAATLFCQQTFGREHVADTFTAPQIVKMFGRTDTAVDCMDYVLRRVAESCAVCDTYRSYSAMFDVWRTFKAYHAAGVKFT